jgi:trans-aconitate methyltransferase
VSPRPAPPDPEDPKIPSSGVGDNRAPARGNVAFGAVAGLYDRVRPAYPAQLAEVTLAYAGALPGCAAEAGAGTGKGTALFAGRGFPIVCVEPDRRMSELLRARFPEVEVVTAGFEEWTPPPAGVDLLFAATAWHWVDPAPPSRPAG